MRNALNSKSQIREEKKKRRMTRKRRRLLLALILFILFLVICGIMFLKEQLKEKRRLEALGNFGTIETVEVDVDDEEAFLEVTYFDAGNGDAVLMQKGGLDILINAWTDSKPEVENAIKEKVVDKKIEYVFILNEKHNIVSKLSKDMSLGKIYAVGKVDLKDAIEFKKELIAIDKNLSASIDILSYEGEKDAGLLTIAHKDNSFVFTSPLTENQESLLVPILGKTTIMLHPSKGERMISPELSQRIQASYIVVSNSSASEEVMANEMRNTRFTFNGDTAFSTESGYLKEILKEKEIQEENKEPLQEENITSEEPSEEDGNKEGENIEEATGNN